VRACRHLRVDEGRRFRGCDGEEKRRRRRRACINECAPSKEKKGGGSTATAAARRTLSLFSFQRRRRVLRGKIAATIVGRCDNNSGEDVIPAT